MDITRAWKDPEYRASLSAEERAALPASPVGAVELTGDELAMVDGGTGAPCVIGTAATAAAGCFTFGSTACNGSCKAFGTEGCC